MSDADERDDERADAAPPAFTPGPVAASPVRELARRVEEEVGRVVVGLEEVVRPCLAAVLAGALPDELLEGRDASHPLRVVAVVSGGNPDPAQLASLK